MTEMLVVVMDRNADERKTRRSDGRGGGRTLWCCFLNPCALGTGCCAFHVGYWLQ